MAETTKENEEKTGEKEKRKESASELTQATQATQAKEEKQEEKKEEKKEKREEKNLLDLAKLGAKEFWKRVRTTAEVKVSDKLVDQVIGQEKGVEIIKKAAAQKRNVLLVGYPGTGKSMIAQAMSELLPVEELQDVLVKPNPVEENNPCVVVVKAGEGKKIIEAERMKRSLGASNINLIYIFFLFIAAFFLLSFGRKELGDVITAAMLIGLFAISGIMMLGMQIGRARMFQEPDGVKLLVDNSGKTKAPFVEATGARAGALLGDCRHDPFQTIVEGKLVVQRGKGFVETDFKDLWKKLAKKYRDLIERRGDGYEAIVLPRKEKILVLGWKKGKIVKTRVHVINRRPYEGEVIEAHAGKKHVTTTPEHSFVLRRKDKNARDLKKDDAVFVLD